MIYFVSGKSTRLFKSYGQKSEGRLAVKKSENFELLYLKRNTTDFIICRLARKPRNKAFEVSLQTL